MNDAILLMQVWPDGPYEEMAQLNNERNAKYCVEHGFDWEFLVGTIDPKYADYNVGSWVKVEQMIRAAKKGYKYIVFLEPDTLIRDMETDLRDGCPVGLGACWHRIYKDKIVKPHWNPGAIYLQNSEPVRDFLAGWLDKYPGPGERELGVFNQLAREGRVVQTISDRWNSTLDCSIVPDAVVLGFHGVGHGDTGEKRLAAMRQTLATL